MCFLICIPLLSRVDWEEDVAKSNSIQTSSMKNITNDRSSSENQLSENSDSVTRKRELVLIAYTIFMVFATLCYVSRSFLFFRMGIRISINLHDMIFRGITRAKMIFFNMNPSGRILNRFARDINIVDSMLPSCIIYVIDVRWRCFHFIVRWIDNSINKNMFQFHSVSCNIWASS